jgi:CPA1 family monovalent cation:H+ antiporter
VAATAVAQRLSIPRRVVTVLEGESLINDATGLVLFKFAVTAVVTGGFSIVDAGQTLAITAIGGVAWGLAVGWIASWLTRLAPEWDVAVLAGLLTPFVCYLPAEHLGLSGVLATVAGGLLFGRRSHDTFTPTIRLKAWAVWEVLLFLLNGLVFVLIGLQLPAVLDEVAGGDWRDVATATLAVVVVVIAVRMVWIFPSVYLPRWLSPALAKRDPAPPWRVTIVIGWAGMRGIVSLAAALALPQTTADGGPFPNRDLILFFAFAVILATLVVQGLTLPPLIRRLGLIADDPVEEAREAKRMALEAALLRVQLLGQAGDAQEASIQLLRERYRHMLRLLDEPPERVAAHARVVEQAISVEREVLRDLLRAGVIDDTLFRELERDLDHQHARLEGGAV